MSRRGILRFSTWSFRLFAVLLFASGLFLLILTTNDFYSELAVAPPGSIAEQGGEDRPGMRNSAPIGNLPEADDDIHRENYIYLRGTKSGIINPIQTIKSERSTVTIPNTITDRATQDAVGLEFLKRKELGREADTRLYLFIQDLGR